MGVKNIVNKVGSGTAKGFKSVGKGVGTGFKALGKGAIFIGTTVYSGTFIASQIAGLVLMVAGLVVIIIMAFSGKKFGLTNLKPPHSGVGSVL